MRAAVVLLAALVASCCVAVTLGLVCLPDACSKQICDYSITAETCQGEFDPKGSSCRCCPFCTKLLEGRIHMKCIRICVEGESETFKEKITGIQIRTFSIIGKPKKMHLTPLPEFPQVLYSIYDRSISEGANCGLTRIRGPSPPSSKCSPGLTCQLVDGVYVCA